MTQLQTPGFHHITMVSRDAGRTLAFYRDTLGVPLVKRTVNFDDPGSYHLYFGERDGAPGTILTFFEWPHAKHGRPGIGGIHHIALGVGTQEDQLRWKRRLTDAGVRVTGPFNRGYFHSIYFRDPDGQILEIATEGPGYTIDETAETLGEAIVQPPTGAEVRGARDEAEIASRTHSEPVDRITDAMRLQGVHHVSGITDDASRARDFYERALGLQMVKQTVNQDDLTTPHLFWAHRAGGLVAPHSAMTLFVWPSAAHRARSGAGQTHHIAFRARSPDEQLAWRDHLLSLNIEVSPVLDRKYFSSIYFRSPDGLLHEIATDGPGFAVDEPAGNLGAHLTLPVWLEPQRDEIAASLAPIG
jgi:glyoxalase family protein